ncbi:hypothetical protein SAMN05444515_101194 [Ectothiorhodospira marina]|uniref:Uncharacterized protein n=1 Tax=Ectothiorhodospira marina TaxID=1396821 RepID=A0A1H7FDT6_9GAMM|nr:hypothetical protein SAMN05444515_101194 [Ectothiorhodospira marina]
MLLRRAYSRPRAAPTRLHSSLGAPPPERKPQRVRSASGVGFWRRVFAAWMRRSSLQGRIHGVPPQEMHPGGRPWARRKAQAPWRQTLGILQSPGTLEADPRHTAKPRHPGGGPWAYCKALAHGRKALGHGTKPRHTGGIRTIRGRGPLLQGSGRWQGWIPVGPEGPAGGQQPHRCYDAFLSSARPQHHETPPPHKPYPAISPQMGTDSRHLRPSYKRSSNHKR